MGVGRPSIGPKVQTAVPPDVAKWITKQAKKRRRERASIVRELVLAGYRVLSEERA